MQVSTRENALEFRTFQGWNGLEELSSPWTALAGSLPSPRFVHFPAWYRAYVSSLETDTQRVRFVAAYRSGTLVGILPLHFQSYEYKGLRPEVFGTIDHDEMQSSDFVFAPTEENRDLLFAFIQWLRGQRTIRWDVLRLRKAAEDSSIAHAARARLPKGSVAMRHDSSSFFQTSGTYEQATEAMSGTFRRNLRRLARRAEQSAPLRYESHRRREDIVAAFETFIDIEASGWKGDSGTSSAIRCRPPMLAFYRALVDEFSAVDACVINVLHHGDQAVAGQFCLKIGNRLSILKIGFHAASGHIAPGNLLLDRTIRLACEDPTIDVVSLVNDPPWARNFKPLRIGVWSYCAPNWNPRGLLLHLGLLAKRRWEGRGETGSEVGEERDDEPAGGQRAAIPIGAPADRRRQAGAREDESAPHAQRVG